LVSANPPFGRATSKRDSAPINSRTPPIKASTSACGSSAAKIPRDRRQGGQAFVLHCEFGAAQDGFGDVVQHQHVPVRLTFVVQQRLGGSGDVIVRAVEPVTHVLGARRLAGAQRFTHRIEDRRVGFRADETLGIAADDVFHARALRAQVRLVRIDDLDRIVGRGPDARDDDRFFGGFHRRGEQLQLIVIGPPPAARFELLHDDVGDGLQACTLMLREGMGLIVADADRSDRDARRRDQGRGGVEHEVPSQDVHVGRKARIFARIRNLEDLVCENRVGAK